MTVFLMLGVCTWSIAGTIYVTGKGGHVIYPDGTSRTCPEPHQRICATMSTSSTELAPGTEVHILDHASGAEMNLVVKEVGEVQDGQIQGSDILFEVAD